jgi:prepilin peptidase CpaA
MGTLMAKTKKGGKQRTELTGILMMTLAGIAVVYDIKTWKIPNWLVLLGLVTGCFVTVVTTGFVNGIKTSMTGMVIPIIVLILLFFIRALGAGDIKLLAAIGTFAGADIGQIILFSFISSGFLSIYYIIRNQIFSVVFHNKLSKAASLDRFTEGKEQGYGRHRIHFSIAILAGVVIYLIYK